MKFIIIYNCIYYITVYIQNDITDGKTCELFILGRDLDPAPDKGGYFYGKVRNGT